VSAEENGVHTVSRFWKHFKLSGKPRFNVTTTTADSSNDNLFYRYEKK
jgi:hypothetical protein